MLKRYETAPFEAVSVDYSVLVNGEPLFVFPARVSAMPINQIFRGKQRSIEETELAAYVRFEGDEAVELAVTVGFDISRAVVVPKSAGIPVEMKDYRNVRFTLPGPGYYTLEINGTHKALHIFYDPLETDIPDKNDPNVIYYGTGIHNVPEIRLQSNQTLYLEGGARIKGRVIAENADNIRICGRGIIDASWIPRRAPANAIMTVNCNNVVVEGVLIQDTPVFAMILGNGENALVDHVKIVGQWRHNSDGIDLLNQRNAVVRNCFVRTHDDCIVVKGVHKVGGKATNHSSVRNLLVEKCVLWNDWGRALELGAETCADEMCDIVFRDCEVLHYSFIACDVQACGDALVHDVLFENIRVGEPLDPQCEPRLCEIFIRPMCWIKGDYMGRVENVTFRNISYNGLTCVPSRMIGYEADSDIRNVSFENITINGRPLTAAGDVMSWLIYNDFVSGVTVNGEPMNLETALYESEKDTCTYFQIGNGAFLTL